MGMKLCQFASSPKREFIFTLVVPDDSHQLLATGESGQIFPLLFQRPVSRESADTSGRFQMTRELGFALIILLFSIFRLSFGFR